MRLPAITRELSSFCEALSYWRHQCLSGQLLLPCPVSVVSCLWQGMLLFWTFEPTVLPILQQQPRTIIYTQLLLTC